MTRSNADAEPARRTPTKWKACRTPHRVLWLIALTVVGLLLFLMSYALSWAPWIRLVLVVVVILALAVLLEWGVACVFKKRD